MPASEEIASISGEWGTVNIFVSAPSYLIDPAAWGPLLRRRVQRVTGSSVERLIRGARAGFASDSFAVIPLQASFQRRENSAPPGPITVGLVNDDPIILPLEIGAKPHWIPINRGIAGTGLEGWAERHGFNVYALRRYLAAHGTAGRDVLVPLLQAEAPRFSRELLAAFRAALLEG